MLREVKALGDAAVTVLGNHDFHLLTVAAGHARQHKRDTIAPILEARDRDELLAWVRTRPLVVIEDERLLVHAGLLPSWTPATALMLSREVQAVLAADRARRLPARPVRRQADAWRDDLAASIACVSIVNACTRLRFCTADGTMEFREKRGPGHAPAGLASVVFAHEARASADKTMRLRPLVDARADACAERADAGFGLPVGRRR